MRNIPIKWSQTMNINIKTILGVAILVGASNFAIAAGTGTSSGGSSNSSGSSSSTTVSPKKLLCKKNEIIVTKIIKGVRTKVCTKVKADLLNDDELYDQGRLLAKEGEYDWALNVLAQIKNQDDPRVLNYTGYSHRKAGRLNTGITYYRKALAINPNFVLAREYLGEGYVAAGLFDLAKLELSEIAKRCGVSCTEYQELNKAIVNAVN
jgi:tetratricopeptide (TPR) repeat protein